MRSTLIQCLIVSTLSCPIFAEEERTQEPSIIEQIRNSVVETITRWRTPSDMHLVSGLYELTNRYLRAYEDAVEFDRAATKPELRKGVSLKMKDVIVEDSAWYKTLEEQEKKGGIAGSSVGEIAIYPAFYYIGLHIQAELAGSRKVEVKREGSIIEFTLSKKKVYVELKSGKMRFTDPVPALGTEFLQQFI